MPQLELTKVQIAKKRVFKLGFMVCLSFFIALFYHFFIGPYDDGPGLILIPAIMLFGMFFDFLFSVSLCIYIVKKIDEKKKNDDFSFIIKFFACILVWFTIPGFIFSVLTSIIFGHIFFF